MRVNLRTLGGKLLVSGELHGSPMELQQALVHCTATFDLQAAAVPPAVAPLPEDDHAGDAGDETQPKPTRRRR